MRHLIAAIVMAAAAVFAGCHTQPQPRLVAFNEEEFAPYDQPGTGVILGQAFMVTRGGDVKNGAGRDVMCVPVTSYSTEVHERWVIGYQPLVDGDPRSKKYSRRAMCNGDGNFRIENLPAGDYYLWCPIEWEYVNGFTYGGPSTAPTGGFAYARARVENGQTTEVVVTRN